MKNKNGRVMHALCYKETVMKKISILTLGCKVNQYESEALGAMFPKDKYEVFSEYKKNCDAYIINTCSVTNMSDRKSRQMIRKCIKNSNNPFIAVMGCYSHAKKNEAENIEGVNFVCGNENKTQTVKKICDYFNESALIKIDNRTDGFDFPMLYNYNEKTRAIVKIQDGCDSFCSYCIIPYLRGRCLKIVAFARDVGRNFNAVGKTNSGDLTKR